MSLVGVEIRFDKIPDRTCEGDDMVTRSVTSNWRDHAFAVAAAKIGKAHASRAASICHCAMTSGRPVAHSEKLPARLAWRSRSDDSHRKGKFASDGKGRAVTDSHHYGRDIHTCPRRRALWGAILVAARHGMQPLKDGPIRLA